MCLSFPPDTLRMTSTRFEGCSLLCGGGGTIPRFKSHQFNWEGSRSQDGLVSPHTEVPTSATSITGPAKCHHCPWAACPAPAFLDTLGTATLLCPLLNGQPGRGRGEGMDESGQVQLSYNSLSWRSLARGCNALVLDRHRGCTLYVS